MTGDFWGFEIFWRTFHRWKDFGKDFLSKRIMQREMEFFSYILAIGLFWVQLFLLGVSAGLAMVSFTPTCNNHFYTVLRIFMRILKNLQGSFNILPRSSRIFKDRIRTFDDLQGSLKIFPKSERGK